MSPETKSSSGQVKAVGNALKVLTLLGERQDPASLSSIARNIDLHKSSVHRLLQTMKEYEFVQQDPKSKKYRIGLKFFEIANTLDREMDIRQQARPFLESLRDEVNETIHLGIIQDHEVVYLDKMEPDRALRMYSAVGKRAPMHATGIGKAVLAHFSDKELDWYIENKGLSKYTEKTITDLSDLNSELEKIRELGYALDNREHEEEIVCVAAPIFEREGRVVGALSIAAPAHRRSVDQMSSLGTMVHDYANKVSAKLGWKVS